MIEARWSGAEEPCIDEIRIEDYGPVALGRYAGASNLGVRKNEDAAIAWAGEDWVFGAVLDAHASSDSATLVLDTLADRRDHLSNALDFDESAALPAVESRLLGILTDKEFVDRCARIRGETAALFAATKGTVLWWLSVGDCLVFHLHHDLARLGQYALNTRQFYQWIGRSNSLTTAVPAYNRGTSRLRAGANHILLVTDGLLECGDHRYERDPARLSEDFLAGGLDEIYRRAVAGECDDAATALAWTVECDSRGLEPTV